MPAERKHADAFTHRCSDHSELAQVVPLSTRVVREDMAVWERYNHIKRCVSSEHIVLHLFFTDLKYKLRSKTRLQVMRVNVSGL
jgi:hypothetical protein